VDSRTLGKDKVSAEMKLPERLAELSEKKVTKIAVGESGSIPASLFSEVSKPLNAGIRTEASGLAQRINADEQFKAK
jgi:hypothetical protein